MTSPAEMTPRERNEAMLTRLRSTDPEPYKEGGYVLRVLTTPGRRTDQLRSWPIAVVQRDGQPFVGSQIGFQVRPQLRTERRVRRHVHGVAAHAQVDARALDVADQGACGARAEEACVLAGVIDALVHQSAGLLDIAGQTALGRLERLVTQRAARSRYAAGSW